MVVSRTAKSNHAPHISDVVSKSTQVMSHRVYEFPSLSFRERFGLSSSTSHASSDGPLRVTIRLPETTTSMMGPPSRRASTRYTRSYTDDMSSTTAAEHRLGGRRVRFELPTKPPPLACGATILGNGSATRQIAGVDNWLRSRQAVESTSSTAPSHGIAAGTVVQAAHTSTVSSCRAATSRVHDTGRYRKGTLPPTCGMPPGEANVTTANKPGAVAVLKAARDADEKLFNEHLRTAGVEGLTEEDVNAVDAAGRTAVSYIAANGSLPMLESVLRISGVDVNKPDNEGNTPLHFAAQAGHGDIVNFILSRCVGVKVDAKNALGFTPLMKAALQGRTRCAKLLIFAGASPTLKDTGKGLRAEEWARYCGRYVCAELIAKISRNRLLERTSSNGRWGSEPDLGVENNPKLQTNIQTQAQGFKTKLKQAFRTKSNSSLTPDKSRYSSLVTQLTSAALCASTPVLPSRGTCAPGVRSLIRPLAVPKLHVTPVLPSGESGFPVPVERQTPMRSSGGSRQINLKKKK